MIAQAVGRESVLGLPTQKRSAREPVMQRINGVFRNVAAMLLFSILMVLSMDTFAADGLLAQPPTPVSNVDSGQSFTVEIGIVVIMFGGALFAVCRSSNRT